MKRDKLIQDITKSILENDAFKEVVNFKIKHNGQAGAESKESKTVDFFKCLMQKDFAGAKAISGKIGDDGSVLLPEEFIADILDLVRADKYNLRAKCTVVPVSYRSGSMPNITSGVELGAALSDEVTGEDKETTPTFEEIAYNVKRIEGFTPVSKDFMNDTIFNIYTILTAQYAKALVKAENRFIISGNESANEWRGIRTDIKSIAVETEGKLEASDLIALQYELDADTRANAVYVVPTQAIRKMALMKDGNGQMLYNPATTGNIASFGGYPVYELNAVPTDLGAAKNETEIVFCDFSKYMIFDKNEYAIEINENVRWMQNQVVMRLQNRADGKLADKEAGVRLTGVSLV